MRVYLDTSSIRKNSNRLNKFENLDVFTSVLAVLELIAGIKETDYELRKKVVNDLLNSSINIDWSTYKKKEYDAFEQPYNDVEGYVIKQMAEKLVRCNDFEEYKCVKIYIDESTYYTFESLEDFDKELSQLGKKFSIFNKNEWSSLEKADRKLFKRKMFDEDFLFPYVRHQSDLSLIYLVEDISGSKRPSEEYFRLIDDYDQSLEVYLKYNCLLFLMHEINGSECSRNDAIDMLHLVYLSKNDTMLSEDKIFEKLNMLMQYIKVSNSDEIMVGE
ncbi:hypothetical protein [Clostridium sp. HBUAS56010]|uniref:hypothetical protein n=1 Tax=Clostridium sp. HBUAS56010 TaxID=2571127 RepID=UPI001178B179|nr:hypothetical protein [Clostridium sp. HBUAS56010]